MDNVNIEVTEKMKGITLVLPYTKPADVKTIPLLPRLSIKIDKLEINGKKRIRGKKALLCLGSDEEYGKLNSKNTTSAESFETINMHWVLKRKDKNYVLEYSSLIGRKPIIFEIPQNSKTVKLDYRIKYPDNTFSPLYTKTVNLIWDIKNSIAKRKFDIYIYGLNGNTKSMYDDKTLFYSFPATDPLNKEDIYKEMEVLYNNLSVAQQNVLKTSFDKACNYIDKLNKTPDEFEGSIDFIDANNRRNPFIGFVFSKITD